MQQARACACVHLAGLARSEKIRALVDAVSIDWSVRTFVGVGTIAAASSRVEIRGVGDGFDVTAPDVTPSIDRDGPIAGSLPGKVSSRYRYRCDNRAEKSSGDNRPTDNALTDTEETVFCVYLFALHVQVADDNVRNK